MKAKTFGGYVTVYLNEPSALNDYQQSVEINWSAIGSSSIERTEEFIKSLLAAVEYAKSLESGE